MATEDGSRNERMGKRRSIAGGVIGAVSGFIATLMLFALFDFGYRADPITSSLVALLVFAPCGAIAGGMVGVSLASGASGDNVLFDNRKSLAVIVAMAAAFGAYFYAVTTEAPSLNPNAPDPVVLQFEVRLPAGPALSATAGSIGIDLQTHNNLQSGRVRSVRDDGGRSVIAGDVELAFRAARRQLEVKVPGQVTRVYGIGLTDKAPHRSV